MVPLSHSSHNPHLPEHRIHTLFCSISINKQASEKEIRFKSMVVGEFYSVNYIFNKH